jgi:hypothetical protein
MANANGQPTKNLKRKVNTRRVQWSIRAEMFEWCEQIAEHLRYNQGEICSRALEQLKVRVDKYGPEALLMDAGKQISIQEADAERAEADANKE